MKQNILNAGMALLLSCLAFSCDESSFLKETPMDFLSPENAYNTYTDYETALTGLYAKVRNNFYCSDFVFFEETDIAKNARDNNNFMGNLKDWLTPQQEGVANVWDREYKLISNANTIISRLENSTLTAEQKAKLWPRPNSSVHSATVHWFMCLGVYRWCSKKTSRPKQISRANRKRRY